jgi:hypothetical protein
MPDKPNGTDDTGEDPQIPLLDDVLGLLPRLVERTSAQIHFSQSLLSMLPCTRKLASRPRIDDGDVPSHEARQPADVLSLLDEGGEAGEDGDGSAADRGDGEDAAPEPAEPVPEVDDLPIPEYDSLAASQVVPRLTTLDPEELEAIGAYESANRSRRTILNRVTALLAD